MFFDQPITVEILGVFKIVRTKRAQVTNDKRIYDGLGIRLSGSADFKCNGKEYTVDAGSMIYVPNNAYYSQKTEGETVIAIHFINYSSRGISDLELIQFDDPKKFHDIALEMYAAWTEKKSGYQHYCAKLFYEFIHLLATQTKKDCLPESSPSFAVSNALNYIHKNYKKAEFSVSELAAMLSVSETYFRRIFKRIYHISPVQYVIKLRLEYASQLLISKLYTVKEVSYKSGFTDVKYFSRVFKAKFKMTPKKYATIYDGDFDMQSLVKDW